MAEPLPPEGYIRLKDAYDTFQFGMHGEVPSLANGYHSEHAAFSKRIDSANSTFTANLSELAYGGKVVSQDGKIHEISSNMFDRTKFADLLGLHDAIPVGISGPLLNYAGGIICLNKEVFFGWLQKELSIHLHGEIQQGKLLPSQANGRLAEVNLPSLDYMPSLEDFRDVVQKEPYWTLPMSVAWIAWRNIDDVVKQFWPYAKHGGHWRDSRAPNQSQPGMNWESAEEPTLSRLMISEAVETHFNNPPSKFIKDSREELWRALQAGELTAIGIEGQASHKKIASERWASLAIQPKLNGREFVGAGSYGDAEIVYDVKLPSKDVLRIWPDTIAAEFGNGILQQSNINQAPISEAILSKWFDQYKFENCSLTRDAIEAAGRTNFGDRVTLTRLRKLYAECAPLGGNKRGRKSAKNNSASSE